jgi:hypothetical protein
MNEITKTIAFVVVAATVSLVAWVTYPSLPVLQEADMRGHELFPDFKDPSVVKSLEIVQYDESSATIRPFKVAAVKNVWTIPSHDNYPADAKDQLAEAAAGLVDLKVLDAPSNDVSAQSLYGVVDPDPKSISAGSTGVGTRVVMKDGGGKTLLSLVIGKEVPGKPDLHYVRKVGQDQIYTVALKTNKLSAKFEDWIEKNLLKMNSWDIKQVQIKDYSVDAVRGMLDRRGEEDIDYNDTGDPKWKLARDIGHDSNDRPIALKLAPDEELNTQKLDNMRTAVDDLKIVDVQPKPKGLSADLKATRDFSGDAAAKNSLASRGFIVAAATDEAGHEEMGLFSNQGEMNFVMKDGVKYTLRFGGLAATGNALSDKNSDKDKKDKKADARLNRYIFVTTQFDPEVIPKPDYEALPVEKKAEEKKAEPKKSEEKKPADAAKAGAKAAPKVEVKKPEEKKADAKKAEPKTDVKADAKKAEAEKKAEADKLKADRERIEKENKRKKDEYDEKVKKGQDRVKELNARFADWYYIISDDVYQKVHLTRAELIKKKEKKADAKGDHATGAGNTPSDFEKLKAGIPGK